MKKTINIIKKTVTILLMVVSALVALISLVELYWRIEWEFSNPRYPGLAELVDPLATAFWICVSAAVFVICFRYYKRKLEHKKQGAESSAPNE